MNFAVIGLGSFGVKRAKAIKSSKIAKLVCISDPDENNAKKAEKELDVPIKSFQQILDSKEIYKSNDINKIGVEEVLKLI